MKDNFDPQSVEQSLYAKWEAEGNFAPVGNGTPYSIAIPPPNITGNLHMGHAFQHTLMDTLIRHQRMKGKRTKWQAGTDHAGIATQMLVERQVIAEGKTRDDLGREAFVERIWEWQSESGGNICQQLRRMGSSLDWENERFTMDDGFSKAVLKVFVDLHREGLIYRGKRLVNWDPALETAISDLEVENQEEQGFLWHLRYPLTDDDTTQDGKDYLVVATTRPETMLGDTAVAVHPDDERYVHLIGKKVKLPLTDRTLTIIADDYVEKEFGTGCVKITPGHDFNDNQMGTRHDLQIINIFTSDAKINAQAPIAYRGMDRFEARKQIVEDLKDLDLLDKIENHKLMVPRGDRSGAIVEPMLTDQWFVKIQPLADPAIKAVENGDIEFVPKQYENTYFAWMRNIQDWCISRQQWWGHRIPAWYDEAGNVYVGYSEEEVRQEYTLDKNLTLRQDEDVLETWFSSSLWSFATLGWPEKSEQLNAFHPTDVLVTGHDIIFFWVARMIMMSLKFMGEVPFHKVYVTGLVRDADGHKMSKTKGNGLDPLDFIQGIDLETLVKNKTSNLTQPQLAARIEKATRRDFPQGIPAYGTDAVRFTFCALAATGRDVRFDLNRIEGYQHFCNKLWNASKFVFSNCENMDRSIQPDFGATEAWIKARLHKLIVSVDAALETYRFDLYANAVYEFAWGEYCDWYLEFAKPALWDESTTPARKLGVQTTLLEVLNTLLRIIHPIMPFITESLWRTLSDVTEQPATTIMLQAFPEKVDIKLDPISEAAVEGLKQTIVAIRNIRGEANIKPSQEVPLLIQGGTKEQNKYLESTLSRLKRLAKVSRVTWLKENQQPAANALQMIGDMRVMIPLEGLIDLEQEKARLKKEIEKLTQELKRVQGKLSNENFTKKAPPVVVEKEQAKRAVCETKIAALTDQLNSL